MNKVQLVIFLVFSLLSFSSKCPDGFFNEEFPGKKTLAPCSCDFFSMGVPGQEVGSDDSKEERKEPTSPTVRVGCFVVSARYLAAQAQQSQAGDTYVSQGVVSDMKNGQCNETSGDTKSSH